MKRLHTQAVWASSFIISTCHQFGTSSAVASWLQPTSNNIRAHFTRAGDQAFGYQLQHYSTHDWMNFTISSTSAQHHSCQTPVGTCSFEVCFPFLTRHNAFPRCYGLQVSSTTHFSRPISASLLNLDPTGPQVRDMVLVSFAYELPREDGLPVATRHGRPQLLVYCAKAASVTSALSSVCLHSLPPSLHIQLLLVSPRVESVVYDTQN